MFLVPNLCTYLKTFISEFILCMCNDEIQKFKNNYKLLIFLEIQKNM